ncbi:MAG TPA: penicillin acylase family protein [Candidatus Dormibacteraeota bacterium]
MILIVFAAVAVVLVLGAAAFAVAFRRRVLGLSLPRTRGTLAVAGIAAPVTVERDQHGVPHIDASSMPDAAFAMGVAHAQDRLWQMEFSRRVAAGRVSEFAGDEGLAVDHFMRRLGLMRVAGEEARRATGDAQLMLEAYAAGVNAVIESGRRPPLEFRLLDMEPEPWLPAHSLGVVKLLALGFGMNWDTELQRMRLLRALGPESAALLDIVYPETHPTTLASDDWEGWSRNGHNGANGALSGFAEAARWIPSMRGGSNAWVVSGARTSTGRPLLANDPHMAPSVPAVWYAAHVRAGSDFESTGVAPPGVPFPLIGHNRRCAWGLTNSFADCQDLVVEEFDGPVARQFRTPGGFEPTRILRELIHVRGRSDDLEEVVITRHGPVVERLDDVEGNVWRGLALQWTALLPGTFGDGLLQLQRAADWSSFRAALAAIDAPSHNAVYADVDGHIGFAVGGRIPVRRQRPSGMPTPGWDDQALWERFLEPDELPSILDPPEGRIVTANNRVLDGHDETYIASDYMNGYRAARIEEMLEAAELDPDLVTRMQMDLLNLPARQVVKLLRGVTCGTAAAERLRRRLAAWDGTMTPSSIEPTIYEAFTRRLAEHALRPLCGDDWVTAAGYDLDHPLFDYPANLVSRMTPELLSRWQKGDTGLLRGGTWAQTASDALDDTWRDLAGRLGRSPRRWRWGRAHALPLEHPFSRRRSLGAFFRRRTLRVGGAPDTVMATSYVPGEDLRTRLAAPTWRQVLDVGNWDACTGVLLPGQSGQPGSAHYDDLIQRWSANRQFRLHWTQDQVRRQSRATLTLTPAAVSGRTDQARAA